MSWWTGSENCEWELCKPAFHAKSFAQSSPSLEDHRHYKIDLAREACYSYQERTEMCRDSSKNIGKQLWMLDPLNRKSSIFEACSSSCWRDDESEFILRTLISLLKLLLAILALVTLRNDWDFPIFVLVQQVVFYRNTQLCDDYLFEHFCCIWQSLSWQLDLFCNFPSSGCVSSCFSRVNSSSLIRRFLPDTHQLFPRTIKCPLR